MSVPAFSPEMSVSRSEAFSVSPALASSASTYCALFSPPKRAANAGSFAQSARNAARLAASFYFHPGCPTTTPAPMVFMSAKNSESCGTRPRLAR